jgi:hypothetical protein
MTGTTRAATELNIYVYIRNRGLDYAARAGGMLHNAISSQVPSIFPFGFSRNTFKDGSYTPRSHNHITGRRKK